VTLHQLLIDAAATSPRAVAVVDPTAALPHDRLEYGALDRRANAMAQLLRATGVRSGDRVVLWAEKSARVVVGMQAALRLGAVYAPADGSTPAGRVAMMARDCAARAVLTTGDRIPALRAELGSDTRYVDLDGPIEAASDPVDTAVEPDEPAYILYTSGSTGAPKGVCASHRNARAFVDWAVTTLAAGEADRFASHAPFTFDLSVLDLYGAFAARAAVHLIPAELAYAPVELVRFLYEQRITVWYSVPSALALMMREGGLLDRPAPDALRAVLFAGEPFPIAQVRQLAAWTDARLFNLYGPTETNVCTFHEVVPADLGRDRPVPIGRPSCGDRVWARRPDGGECQPGEEGELIVDGPTVMRGYWGRPPHQGPYPTGDVVRVLPDGAFDYLGRSDHMVKVRGNRIELGEVEAALTAHPDVAEAGAMVVGQGIDARLVVFAAPVPGRELGVLDLKRHAAERLPRYMLADEVHIVTGLPRTANGKLDRRALAAGTRIGATAAGGLA
jgi:clorobiocin biosynthesis protein CloN4